MIPHVVAVIVLAIVIILCIWKIYSFTQAEYLPPSVFTGFWEMDKEFQKSAGLIDSYMYIGKPTGGPRSQRYSHILIMKNDGRQLINSKTWVVIDLPSKSWSMKATCEGFPSKMSMTYTPDDGTMLLHHGKTLHAKFIKNNQMSGLVKPEVIHATKEAMVDMSDDSATDDDSGSESD